MYSIFIAIAILFQLVLQGYLSLKKNKLWGLIIPLLILIRILYVVMMEINNYGSYVSRGGSAPLDSLLLIDICFGSLVLSVFLIIYWVCRIKRKRDENS